MEHVAPLTVNRRRLLITFLPSSYATGPPVRPVWRSIRPHIMHIITCFYNDSDFLLVGDNVRSQNDAVGGEIPVGTLRFNKSLVRPLVGLGLERFPSTLASIPSHQRPSDAEAGLAVERLSPLRHGEWLCLLEKCM